MYNAFWFRRDLRLNDNHGLYHALRSGLPVIPIFIFDTNILEKLSSKRDARVQFIHAELKKLNREFKGFNSRIHVYHGNPETIWAQLLKSFRIEKVFTNKDYEPYAKLRDESVRNLLEKEGIAIYEYKDHVIFEFPEVCKKDGNPYTVFTPYKRKWLEAYSELKPHQLNLKGYPSEDYLNNFNQTDFEDIPDLEEIGFERPEIEFPSRDVPQTLIRNYHKTRNYPGKNGTSRLGIHFRFGTISIREKVRKAASLNDTYLSELIWRDFYAQILDQFPHVVDRAFKAKYDLIEWRNDEEEFEKWCEGQTGYPIVDAGMRELYNTGYMHNRSRMITASFLTKHLLIDWRWGEAYFAEKLLDYELASNNGGWQWAAGTGTDAAPYFRIFNPYTQQKKFDPEYSYIKKWVPEWGSSKYPDPIVDHKEARERCLKVYQSALNDH